MNPPRQVRKFEVLGVRWIARLQPYVAPVESGAEAPSGKAPEPGIWFENETGQCRFLAITRPEEHPDPGQFMLLSGRQLGRLLERAVVK